MDYLPAVAAIVADYVYWKRTTAHAQHLHEIEKEQATVYHEKELSVAKQAKRTHLLTIFGELQREFVQLDGDMAASNKESESDMYEQRNQQLQTLIISSSVMFAGGNNNLCDREHCILV